MGLPGLARSSGTLRAAQLGAAKRHHAPVAKASLRIQELPAVLGVIPMPKEKSHHSKCLATRPQLTWAHYRALIPVADPRQRGALATEANRSGWGSDRWARRLVKSNPKRSRPEVATPPS